MSVRIIEVFVKMREMLAMHKEILRKIEKLEKKDFEQDQKILVIFEYLKQFEKAKQEENEYRSRPKIGFRKQKYG